MIILLGIATSLACSHRSQPVPCALPCSWSSPFPRLVWTTPDSSRSFVFTPWYIQNIKRYDAGKVWCRPDTDFGLVRRVREFDMERHRMSPTLFWGNLFTAGPSEIFSLWIGARFFPPSYIENYWNFSFVLYVYKLIRQLAIRKSYPMSKPRFYVSTRVIKACLGVSYSLIEKTLAVVGKPSLFPMNYNKTAHQHALWLMTSSCSVLLSFLMCLCSWQQRLLKKMGNGYAEHIFQ